MTATTYNGWRNHATWDCHNWLSNDPDLFAFAQYVARKSFDPVTELSVVARHAGIHDKVTAFGEVDWWEITVALRQ